MRSKAGKTKLMLDRVERLKYKTLRRMDKMKLKLIEVNQVIEKLKGDLQSDRT